MLRADAVICHSADPKNNHAVLQETVKYGDMKSGGEPQNHRPELLPLTPTDTQNTEGKISPNLVLG